MVRVFETHTAASVLAEACKTLGDLAATHGMHERIATASLRGSVVGWLT